MHTKLHRLTIAAVLLAAALLAVPAAAEPQPGQLLATAGLWSQLWNTLACLWGDAGCCLDPDGRCGRTATKGEVEQPTAGCIIDPNGGMPAGSAEQTDAGCILDPNGGCDR